MDACPECGYPVVWEGSKIANKRYRAREQARPVKRRKVTYPPGVTYLLAQAKATFPKPEMVEFKKTKASDQAARLTAYEEALGEQVLRDATDKCIADGDKGMGVFSHVLNLLESGYKGKSKKGKANAQSEGKPRDLAQELSDAAAAEPEYKW